MPGQDHCQQVTRRCLTQLSGPLFWALPLCCWALPSHLRWRVQWASARARLCAASCRRLRQAPHTARSVWPCQWASDSNSMRALRLPRPTASCHPWWAGSHQVLSAIVPGS